MKKAILSIGLFSMMMVLTSFSTNNEGGDLEAFLPGPKSYSLKYGQQLPLGLEFNADSRGGQQVPPSKGLDFSSRNNGQQLPLGKDL